MREGAVRRVDASLRMLVVDFRAHVFGFDLIRVGGEAHDKTRALLRLQRSVTDSVHRRRFIAVPLLGEKAHRLGAHDLLGCPFIVF